MPDTTKSDATQSDTTRADSTTGEPARHSSTPVPDHDPHNPKLDANPGDNTVKNPDDWTTGGEPMTGAQASYLKTLSEQAHTPDAFSDDLSKAEASKRIDALKSNGSAA